MRGAGAGDCLRGDPESPQEMTGGGSGVEGRKSSSFPPEAGEDSWSPLKERQGWGGRGDRPQSIVGLWILAQPHMDGL